MNGPGLRIEEAVGGRVKNGRTKIQVEMIVGTEKIRGVEVSAHTGTQVIVASVLIKQSNTL